MEEHVKKLEGLGLLERCRAAVCLHRVNNAVDLQRQRGDVLVALDACTNQQLYCPEFKELQERKAQQKAEAKTKATKKAVDAAVPVLRVTFLPEILADTTTLQPGEKRATHLYVPDIHLLDSWLGMLRRGGVPRTTIDGNPISRIPMENKNKTYIFRSRFSAVSEKEFNKIAHQFVLVCMRNGIQTNDKWFEDSAAAFSMSHQPIFVEKIEIEADSKVFLVGDLHSSLESLLNILGRFRDQGLFGTSSASASSSFKLRPKNYIVFLGDLVDRGPFGVEVLFLALKLVVENPSQVFIIAGNHEDCEVYARDGFARELLRKFDKEKSDDLVLELLKQTWFLRYLPTAIFLKQGPFVYQLSHGAITENRTEQAWLQNFLKLPHGARYTLLYYYIDETKEIGCGPSVAKRTANMKWGDFYGGEIDEGYRISTKRGGDTLEFGYRYTKEYADKLGLTAIIGGHQDFSNFTMLTSKNADTKNADREEGEVSDSEEGEIKEVEPDINFKTLWRPKNYIKLDLVQYATFIPGVDFIACNTSSAFLARQNFGLMYDCFLTLSISVSASLPFPSSFFPSFPHDDNNDNDR